VNSKSALKRRAVLRRGPGWAFCASCKTFSTSRLVEVRLSGEDSWSCPSCFERLHRMPGFAVSVDELTRALTDRGDSRRELLLLLARAV
jgi:hypothetical protein